MRVDAARMAARVSEQPPYENIYKYVHHHMRDSAVPWANHSRLEPPAHVPPAMAADDGKALHALPSHAHFVLPCLALVRRADPHHHHVPGIDLLLGHMRGEQLRAVA